MKNILKAIEKGYDKYSMLVFADLMLYVGAFLVLSCFDIPDIIRILAAMLPSLMCHFSVIFLNRKMEENNILLITAVEFMAVQSHSAERYYHNSSNPEKVPPVQ